MDGESQPNVGQVLEEIRTRLERQIAGALERGELSSPAAPGDFQDSLGLNELLIALHTAQSQFGSINPRPAGLVSDLLQSVKKGIRKLIAWYLRPVAHFQSVATQFLAEAARILERQQVQLRSMEEKIEALRVELHQLRLQMQSERGLVAPNLEQRERDPL
jgi:hypothetical protein